MSEEPGERGPSSFEDRLRAARGRRGLDAPPPLSARDTGDIGGMSPLGVGLRVGVELVSALVVAVAIGWGLDYLFGTNPILMAVFVLLGGAAGVLNVWRLFAPRPTREPKVRDGGR
jgi:ATP synthase protein I